MGYDASLPRVRLTKADPDPTPTDPTEPVPVSVPTAEQIKVDPPSDKTGRDQEVQKPSSRWSYKNHFQGMLGTLGFLGSTPPGN